MAELFANENVPLALVHALRSLGHDVLTMLEAGLANQRVPDESVLQEASSRGRIVLTLNRKDFIKLHQQHAGSITPPHAGIVVCTSDINFGALAERISSELSAIESYQGRLIRVQRGHKIE